jgi:hypothetical protein
MSNNFGIYALLTSAGCAICGIAGAQDDQRLVVPLSDPSRPARLEINLFSGDISVEGYDGKEVVIVADAPIRDADAGEPPRSDGLRRIQSSSVGLTVEENDNTVSVHMDFSPKNADLQIRVPRRTSVKARLVNGGDVEIDSVTGEHELSNVNGDVIATDIAGSAVINATNGDVRATFTSVEAMKPMSFTSFNGDVDVTPDRRQPARRRLHGFRRRRSDRSAERPAESRAQGRQGNPRVAPDALCGRRRRARHRDADVQRRRDDPQALDGAPRASDSPLKRRARGAPSTRSVAKRLQPLDHRGTGAAAAERESP